MKRSFLQSAMLKSIDFYRRSISPHKGGRLAAWRLLRCNPWSKGGYDPVPEDPCVTMKKE